MTAVEISEVENQYTEEYQDSGLNPLNRFIASQGLVWYDHDFCKDGRTIKDGTVFEKFEQQSYARQWDSQIEALMVAYGVQSINAFVMIGKENPKIVLLNCQVRKSPLDSLRGE